MTDNEKEIENDDRGIKSRITGLGQEIIGEIEIIGGVLTGDPNTQAEGEFNVEVGTVREELDESIDEDTVVTDQKD